MKQKKGITNSWKTNSRQTNRKITFAAAALLMLGTAMPTMAQQLKGSVTDRNSKETLIGAVVSVEGTNVKAVTDVDGCFELRGLKNGTYTLYINYMGYKPQRIEGVKVKKGDAEENMDIELLPDEKQLKEVVVTAVEQRSTEAAMVEVAKNSEVIVSNVSAQEISKTQDTNAGEVIRRVPGVSLIDDKFVMVRGLSQRYNNVWVNGGAVPSSEADSRAFSFDIIPSSQIDNLTIVKSPSAEYPADYSGGFIIVNTKEIPTVDVFLFSRWQLEHIYRFQRFQLCQRLCHRFSCFRQRLAQPARRHERSAEPSARCGGQQGGRQHLRPA